MKFHPSVKSSRGFALVLTLALLALLVLAVFALATLGRVNAQLATTSVYQTQARQNALVGLSVAMGQLQREAGPDSTVTAMAGITGVPAGSAGGQRRHWCGVWNSAGTFRTWLVSGATASPVPTLAPDIVAVPLVANGSVGSEATNSEHVTVGRISVEPIDPVTGMIKSTGGYAFWVGDEGAKISAYSPEVELVQAGLRPLLASTPIVSLTLKNSLLSYAATLPRLLSFEQLRLLPSPASPLSNSTIWDNFHQVTLTHFRLQTQGPGTIRRAGMVNLNTTSQPVWNSLATTYNAFTTTVAISNPATVGNRMRDNFPAAGGIGKSIAGPFLSVSAFQNSSLLATALTGQGATPAQFMAVMSPLLTTRSDTFRVRAYGNAVNPADENRTEAAAYCEAVVQRTPEAMPGVLGRRFVITYFRWLAVDDI